MKIAIVGANGKTGFQTILKALDMGHSVTAIVRNPATISLKHECLQIKRADLLSENTALEEAIAGHDAVISAIGISSGLNAKVTLYSKGTDRLIKALSNKGVKRLVCISSIGIDQEKDPNIPFIFQDVLFPLIFSNSAADMRKMESSIKDSELNWTIIRPAGLTNKLPTWKYRIAVAPSLPRPYVISRADVADFMIKALDKPEYFRQTVSLAD
ncbi:MAG: SDR family oxidoreductase [Chloroflexi bacterium]|uniref:SDR family oxidoreductase n=1 Tax=Candidatus Chlorohelix allophototropha TaxID=3003348 RepID=A0A8T7M6F4_9CHLR|nr:SDR family oxidoreductase [Chloroflexota bacterium]WJW69579.1 SDR family oxidoreductase [Chloroflexota bacterium L227-S17]